MADKPSISIGACLKFVVYYAEHNFVRGYDSYHKDEFNVAITGDKIKLGSEITVKVSQIQRNNMVMPELTSIVIDTPDPQTTNINKANELEIGTTLYFSSKSKANDEAWSPFYGFVHVPIEIAVNRDVPYFGWIRRESITREKLFSLVNCELLVPVQDSSNKKINYLKDLREEEKKRANLQTPSVKQDWWTNQGVESTSRKGRFSEKFEEEMKNKANDISLFLVTNVNKSMAKDSGVAWGMDIRGMALHTYQIHGQSEDLKVGVWYEGVVKWNKRNINKYNGFFVEKVWQKASAPPFVTKLDKETNNVLIKVEVNFFNDPFPHLQRKSSDIKTLPNNHVYAVDVERSIYKLHLGKKCLCWLAPNQDFPHSHIIKSSEYETTADWRVHKIIGELDIAEKEECGYNSIRGIPDTHSQKAKKPVNREDDENHPIEMIGGPPEEYDEIEVGNSDDEDRSSIRTTSNVKKNSTNKFSQNLPKMTNIPPQVEKPEAHYAKKNESLNESQRGGFKSPNSSQGSRYSQKSNNNFRNGQDDSYSQGFNKHFCEDRYNQQFQGARNSKNQNFSDNQQSHRMYCTCEIEDWNNFINVTVALITEVSRKSCILYSNEVKISNNDNGAIILKHENNNLRLGQWVTLKVYKLARPEIGGIQYIADYQSVRPTSLKHNIILHIVRGVLLVSTHLDYQYLSQITEEEYKIYSTEVGWCYSKYKTPFEKGGIISLREIREATCDTNWRAWIQFCYNKDSFCWKIFKIRGLKSEIDEQDIYNHEKVFNFDEIEMDKQRKYLYGIYMDDDYDHETSTSKSSHGNQNNSSYPASRSSSNAASNAGKTVSLPAELFFQMWDVIKGDLKFQNSTIFTNVHEIAENATRELNWNREKDNYGNQNTNDKQNNYWNHDRTQTYNTRPQSTSFSHNYEDLRRGFHGSDNSSNNSNFDKKKNRGWD